MSLSSKATMVLVTVGSAVALVAPAAVAADAPLLHQVSADPYTTSDAQHATEVEPDTFSWGDTVVSAFQVGRSTNGGAANIGWASSDDGGVTWRHGFLPLTVVAGGPWTRASDPVVTFDAKAHVWLIQALALDSQIHSAAVVLSRSFDAIHWSDPVTVTERATEFYDKPWITCDNHRTSPFYGNCYAEADLTTANLQIVMVRSTDGGLTWSDERSPVDTPHGPGGVPLVRPDGTVVVPYLYADIEAFTSTDGGASWTASVSVSTDNDASAPGLREEPLPSAAMDAAGKVYLVWDDCRFRVDCTADDIVLTTSADGVTWSPVTRVPIDAVTSGVSYFTPGIAVDPSTYGAGARIGLYYNSYPDAACAVAACQLDVGYVSSTNGGNTWSAPRTLAGPFPISWLAQAGGAFVGDYNAAAVVHGRTVSVFAVAHAPAGSTLNEPMVTAGPLSITGGG